MSHGGLFALGGLLLWQTTWLWGGLVALVAGVLGVQIGLQAVWAQYAEQAAVQA